MNSSSRTVGRWQWAVLIGLFLVIGAIVLLTKAFGSSRDPRTEVIRRQGLPVTLAELNSWYPAVGAPSNTALIYAGLLAETGRNQKRDQWTRPAGRLGPADLADLTAFLNRNERILTGLHQVPPGPARYPVDLRQGFNTMMAYLPALKDGTLLLCAEADYFFATGEPGKAIDSLIAAANVADSLNQEPMLVSHLVRSACWNLIVNRMAQGFSDAKVPERDLQRLAERLQSAERPEGLRRALIGERAMGISIFDDARYRANMLSGGSGTPKFGARMGATAMRLSGVLTKDRVVFLDHLSNLVYATELSYPARFHFGEGAITNLALAKFQIVSRMLLPALGRSFAKDADCTARIRCARVLVAIEEYRRAHGEQLPAKLQDALSPQLAAVAIDPFDGQPLRYKPEGQGYVVYSIGEDLCDDGGTEPPKKNGGKAGGPQPFDVCLRIRPTAGQPLTSQAN